LDALPSGICTSSCYNVYMTKRTTIELDEELLARAKRALGIGTTRATVEEALRRAAEQAEGEHDRRAADQLRYLEQLPARVDLEVLTGDEMWQ
jgi:Arc/MetJ family transcription regulator